MLKLFRKFRLQVIQKGRLGNYLLYAVGEIVLVVIGILIALAINNQNQKRILAQKEQTYLQGLHDEFTTSKRKLEELIKVNNANFTAARSIITEMSRPEAAIDEVTFSQLLLNTVALDISFNPNNSLLTEMINSGSLKDISNPALRIHLTNWIATLEDISKQEEDLRLQRERVVDFFRQDDYSIRTVFDQTGVSEEQLGFKPQNNIHSNLALLSSRAFENNLLIFILTSEATEKNHYFPLLEELEQILSLLAAELDR